MKTLLKAVVLATGLSALLPALASDELTRQSAELNQKIFATAQSGDHRGALAMANDALANDERQYGKEHAALLPRLYIQSQLLRQTGADQQQLEGVAARIGNISKAVLAGQDIEQLYITGDFYAQINNSSSAEPFFTKVVALADARGDTDPTWLYRGLGQLGKVQSSTRSGYGKATATLERLVALREKHQGKTHHDLVAPLSMLAKVKEAAGEPYYRRVLEIERQHHEESHQSVMGARLKLAEFYADQNMSRQALAALDSYMASIEKFDPQQGLSGALILPLLLKGRVLAETDAFPEAAQALQRVSGIVSSQKGVPPANRGPMLGALLDTYSLVGSRSQSRLGDDRLKRLTEATYQRQLAAKDLPPELTFALKQERFRRLYANPPINPISMEVDRLQTASALTGILQDLLTLRERHWPADDPVLKELREGLAKAQAEVKARR
jgi:hypothetical protein